MKTIALNERERVFVLRGIQDNLDRQRLALLYCTRPDLPPAHPEIIQEYRNDIELLEALYRKVASSS